MEHNSGFILLDISKNEIKEENDKYNEITYTDREIFFIDSGVERFVNASPNLIENFVRIDEWADHMRYIYNTEKSSSDRNIWKLWSEYASVNVSKENYINANTKFYTDGPRDKYKNFIVSKVDKLKNNSNISYSNGFATNVNVKQLGYKILPRDVSINVISENREHGLKNMNYNNFFRNELNKAFAECENHIFLKTDSLYNSIKHYSMYSHTPHWDIYRGKRANWQLEGYDIYKCCSPINFYTEEVFNFLRSKPCVKNVISNLYYCFDIDNNLKLLENICITDDINQFKNIFEGLERIKNNRDKYETGIKELMKSKSRLSRLEHMCKIKYPNLFNPSSKEMIFTSRTHFSLDLLPIPFKKALITEYNNSIKNEEKELENKCEHKKLLIRLRGDPMDYSIWKEVKEWIGDYKKTEGMITCPKCDYNMMCSHEYSYFSMFFSKDSEMSYNSQINRTERISQILNSKYASKDNILKSSYCSFCKFCGMEILNMRETDGISFDESSNRQKEVPISSGDEQSMVKKQIMFLINQNIRFKPVNKRTMYAVMGGIYENIIPILSVINKKKTPKKNITNQSGQYDNNQFKDMNMVLLVLVAIMILSIKYDWIDLRKQNQVFGDDKKGKNIIVSKNKVSDKFRTVWDILNANYLKGEFSVGKSDSEKWKRMIVKAYELLKEVMYENISVSEENIISHTSDGVAEEYLKINRNIIAKSKDNAEYKLKSYDSFSYFLQKQLYNTYASDRNETGTISEWKEFIDKSKEIKLMEKRIVENNTKSILYPYGKIPYSYARYYKADINDSWDKDMILYSCVNTGKRHVWDSYIFESGKKILEFKISDISKGNEDIKNINNGRIIAMRCKNCKQTTDELKKNEEDAKLLIQNKVIDINNIQSFYITYKYRCLKSQYHEYVKTGKDAVEYSCKICGIKFSYISSLEKGFYEKNKNIFFNHVKETENIKNTNIAAHKESSDHVSTIDIHKYSKSKAEKSKKYMSVSILDRIKSLNTDKQLMLQNIGESESYEESKLSIEKLNNDNRNDILLKLCNKIKQIIIVIGILKNNPSKHSYENNIEFSNLEREVKHSELDSKINELYKEIISDRILESIRKYKEINPDGVDGAIGYSKNVIFTLLQKSKEIKTSLYEFLLNLIIESDIIFTSYDYGELKKTYNMNKTIEENIESEIYDSEISEGVENEDGGDSALFDSSDLSMNNFIDDDIDEAS